jgi:hypothetical protein
MYAHTPPETATSTAQEIPLRLVASLGAFQHPFPPFLGALPTWAEGTFFLFQSHARAFLSNPSGRDLPPIFPISPIAPHSSI